MFYSNIRLHPKLKDGKYGVYFRNCYNETDGIFLPVSTDLKVEFGGFKSDLSVRIFDDIPAILPERNNSLFLLLSTVHDPNSIGAGVLGYLGTQNIDFVCRPYIRKYGAEKFYIIRANENNVFRVTWGDGDGRSNQTFYFVKNKKVIVIQQYENVQRMMREMDLQLPVHKRTGLRYDFNEWRYV
ncbi:hypothetical protein IKD98_04240 [Candidatus Saccharibacteria bacterium]|nr:hypothetical protein [Candidatus Saccharibacteria bacterium]